MGVGMAGDQLYVSVIMTILRRWQQRQHQPSYAEFLKELEENQEFSKQQSGPMKQRLQLLRCAPICDIPNLGALASI